MSELRIAHLADTHINDNRRLGDTSSVLARFCEQARDARVDLIVHAGDFFDRKSTPAERNVLAEFLVEAASIAPVVGVRGNHDMDGDLAVFSRLDTKHPVTILETPGWVDTGLFGVFGLPWFTRSHLLSRTDAAAGDVTQRTISAAESLLEAVRHEARERAKADRVPILLSHCLVAGSETSTGQTLIGQTVELAPATLRDAGCEYVALGHIHKPQGWYGNVRYSGSTERMNFGEPEDKGWVLATFRNGRFSESTFVDLPARRIVLIEVDDQDIEQRLSEIRDGDLVRYRYRVRPEDLHTVDEVRIAAQLRAAGAQDVKLEAVLVHEDRVRCEAIVDAESTWEKVCAYWDASSTTVDDATRERVRTKLADLETPQGDEVAA